MEANNMAAMREALAGLIDGICFHCDLSGDCKGAPCEKMQKAKAALAAPPRNCDVGTAEEQGRRFALFCLSASNCRKCPIHNLQCKTPHRSPCAIRWAQMPCEEGGAK